MRTPNTCCEICKKPVYRRPSELKKWKSVCCKECRSELYKNRPPSKNLELGRTKGDNHLTGIPKSAASNLKRSISHKKYWAEHPEQLVERGKKIRGEKHYHWNGNATKLNQAIRIMTENRKWMDAVKERDNHCTCGSINNLESHYIIPIATLIISFNIKLIKDARQTKELWDINNGITLCRKCHYKLHGRTYAD